MSKQNYIKRNYPMMYNPMEVKVQSVVVPKKRISINEWFNKFIPNWDGTL